MLYDIIYVTENANKEFDLYNENFIQTKYITPDCLASNNLFALRYAYLLYARQGAN